MPRDSGSGKSPRDSTDVEVNAKQDGSSLPDFSFLNLCYKSADGSTVLADYIEEVANKGLLRYKQKTQTGGKAGESLWTHVMNLVTIIEKLRTIFELDADEMSCLLLALTVHDLNKLDEYGAGKNYPNAAKHANILKELAKLDVEPFFLAWQDYSYDIAYLAHAHQVGSLVATVFDQRFMNHCRLDQDRLEGPLKFLMRVADVSDNTHSSDHMAQHEIHIRDKLLVHVNAALNGDGRPQRYRFVGHRLAELRGILTNVIHNEIVAYFQHTYGKEACIDLLYHPEGVDYLLDTHLSLQWNTDTQHTLAKRIGQRFAGMQSAQLAQFIRAKPSGISVDDAAMQSGASLQNIFRVILGIVQRKQYRLEWREERNALVRSDLETALADKSLSTDLREHILVLLRERDLVPADDEMLRRGEFAAAYRNFLKDHRSDSLKAVKLDSWERVARLFQLPESGDALYSLIDPYRRGYFLARDLPTRSLEEMMEDALVDLKLLETQASAAKKAKKVKREEAEQVSDEQEEQVGLSFDTAYILDYLHRHLEVWDGVDSQSTYPVSDINFAETLRRYADSARSHIQCCHCGSPLQASEWMSIQVPSNIGVQSFSNRLDGGSTRDPKRNVCEVCRTQFILEKLAWRAHRDKQGSEQVTFYLHLFPYSFFTQPMLLAWWQSIERLRDGEHQALFLDTREYFKKWEETYQNMQVGVQPRFFKSGTEGLGIPTFSTAISNAPVLPLIVSGSNYGTQFLLALEKSVLLARWFGSRILLSRMPVPVVNLEQVQIDNQPVALLVENAPRSMSWLLPENALTPGQLEMLCRKFSKFYQIIDALSLGDDDAHATIYGLVSAMADDPFAIYHEIDRLIERQVARRKGQKPEYRAIGLSGTIAPLLEEITKL